MTDALDPRAAQEASEWFVLLGAETCTEADRRAWRQWRDADPRHEQAWQRVERVAQRLGVLEPSAALTALGRAAPRRRRLLQTLALAGVTVGAGWMGYRHMPWRAWAADYQTATGEQREVTLPDGTRLVLNTATAVNVAYGDRLRRVELVRGELHVATAADRLARRFVVATRFADLVPLGTRFSVRQQEDWVRLTVHEGTVQIENPRPVRRVPAGATVLVNAQGPGDTAASPENAEAWTHGMLLADGLPLADFVAELGRYRTGRLACDPAVAGLRLSGAFPLRDTDRALAAVARALPVRVVERTPLWVRIEAL
ncbi:MAG: FecR domain-containing protein [Acidovorax sp.]